MFLHYGRGKSSSLTAMSHSLIKKTDLSDVSKVKSHVKQLLYHHVLLRKINEQLKDIPFKCSVLQ